VERAPVGVAAAVVALAAVGVYAVVQDRWAGSNCALPWIEVRPPGDRRGVQVACDNGWL